MRGIPQSLLPTGACWEKQGIPRTPAWVSASLGHTKVKETGRNEIKLGSRYMRAPEAAG